MFSQSISTLNLHTIEYIPELDYIATGGDDNIIYYGDFTISSETTLNVGASIRNIVSVQNATY